MPAVPATPHLFEPAGLAALQVLMTQRPLLAFDFDGTLAPIVARPDDARIAPELAARLARLAEHTPVAVVTGRAVADVRVRLGFAPTFVVGNHGAEDETLGPPHWPLAQALDGLRARVAGHAQTLADAGVQVEDKGLSMAFHYRLAPDRRHARRLLRTLLGDVMADVKGGATADGATGAKARVKTSSTAGNTAAAAVLPLHVFAGKCVLNAVPAGAPDKAHAVHRLRARCRAGAVLFAGDDLNDEPVFAAAEPGWVTVRIGHGAGRTSRARWFLQGTQEMAALLDHLLTRAPRPQAPTP